MRFEVAPLPLDVVVCFFLWTGIVPSLWEFVWNVSRNGICLYYYLVYPSLGRLYFTHNSGWHLEGDINYIYSKAQEVIRGKNVQNIDLDGNARKIQAYQKNSFRKTAGKITIVIKPANETTQGYSIDVDFISGASTSKILAINARSKFINEFIGKLLTKEISSGDK